MNKQMFYGLVLAAFGAAASVLPAAASTWTYSAGVLSDGIWSLSAKATASGDLTVTGFNSTTDATAPLDFSGGVSGNYRIVAFSSYGLAQKLPSVETLVLPDTLVTVPSVGHRSAVLSVVQPHLTPLVDMHFMTHPSRTTRRKRSRRVSGSLAVEPLVLATCRAA